MRAAVSGWPTMGAAEQSFVLLTLDDADYPHPCLLSRAAVDSTDELIAVVAGRTTPANLRRHPRATLMTRSNRIALVCPFDARRAARFSSRERRSCGW